MSSKGKATKSKQDMSAAGLANKLNQLETKEKNVQDPKNMSETENAVPNDHQKESSINKLSKISLKGNDEVDRAILEDKNEKRASENETKLKAGKMGNVELINSDKTREQVKAERAAKKAVKQAKKKGDIKESSDPIKKIVEETIVASKKEFLVKPEVSKMNNDRVEESNLPVEKDLTVQDVVDTLKDIVNVAKEVQAVTDKVKAIELGGKKSEESNKSKAELKAERRAKQEAQRAAKMAQQKLVAKSADKDEKKMEDTQKLSGKTVKTTEKSKPKVQSFHRVNWFQHLYTEHDKESLKKIALNSNLHPAIIKLGVQLASQVVTGSNARCIALLDALKKMVRDYSLPAKTEFARGLESHLAASLEFLWAMRQPSASQTNAIKYFRRQLNQLPNNVDEFDAKKALQEEIDRYIREQIDMAGEAISIAVRNKISNGDNILTYGCSSLIERILCEAWSGGARFRAVVVGDRVRRGAREMLRRLEAAGLPCAYADVTAVSFLMGDVNKVILGACSLLVNGSVLGPVGSAQVALVARSHNVPVLVACETHKFSERVQTDAFVYNELGDPDDLIDKSDDNSPLRDWRSSPNLTLLNLTYDVTPPSLVTAVVTELAILPCTSAPVVVRFKQSEYGI
ncbi:unnamed protein product, partial [Iphiclides podalirius]